MRIHSRRRRRRWLHGSVLISLIARRLQCRRVGRAPTHPNEQRSTGPRWAAGKMGRSYIPSASFSLVPAIPSTQTLLLQLRCTVCHAPPAPQHPDTTETCPCSVIRCWCWPFWVPWSPPRSPSTPATRGAYACGGGGGGTPVRRRRKARGSAAHRQGAALPADPAPPHHLSLLSALMPTIRSRTARL